MFLNCIDCCFVGKPEELSLSGLYDYVTYLKASEQDASRYELAFWRKLTQPLYLDGETIVIKYCRGNDEDLDYLKEKGLRELELEYSLPPDDSFNPDFF